MSQLPVSPVLLAALHDHAVADARSWCPADRRVGLFSGLYEDELRGRVAFSPTSPHGLKWLAEAAKRGQSWTALRKGTVIDEPQDPTGSPRVQAFSGHRSVSVEDYWSLRAAIAAPQPATG